MKAVRKKLVGLPCLARPPYLLVYCTGASAVEEARRERTPYRVDRLVTQLEGEISSETSLEKDRQDSKAREFWKCYGHILVA